MAVRAGIPVGALAVSSLTTAAVGTTAHPNTLVNAACELTVVALVAWKALAQPANAAAGRSAANSNTVGRWGLAGRASVSLSALAPPTHTATMRGTVGHAARVPTRNAFVCHH